MVTDRSPVIRRLNMKTFCNFLLAFLLVSVARAEEHPNASPERVIHDFYQWYVQALLQNGEPLTQNRARLKRFVSERLIKEIDRARKGPDGLDGDPFVDAQDFDKEWAKNISVSHLVLNGKTATAVVELKSKEMGTRKLNLTLVQTSDGWKVDRVEGEK